MALIVGVLTILASCQKEDVEDAPKSKHTDGIESSLGDIRPIPYDTAVCGMALSKAGYIKKKSAVFFMDYDEESGEPVMHKYVTLKIRNIKGDLCQEWFLEDLHSNYFTHSSRPDDDSGTKYGYYYPWKGTLDDITQEEWNILLFQTEDMDGENANGFHIPNCTDFIKLNQIVGQNEKLQNLLQVEYDGTYRPRTDDWQEDAGGFWQSPYDPTMFHNPYCIDPGLEDGCGIIMLAFLNNPRFRDGFWACYTNVKDIRCNVRLMRTISKSQWK